MLARRGGGYIEVIGMAGDQYYGEADDDGLKRGFISPNYQMILLGTTLEHLIQLRICPGFQLRWAEQRQL